VSPSVRRATASTEVVPGGQNVAPVAGSDLEIQSGDLLAISLYGIPDFSKEARVTERGNITLPLIGDVHLAGLTIHGAEALVQSRLIDGGFFKDPQVSIMARESVSQGTSVLGEVERPGIYFLPGQHSLFDALAAAGGTTQRAGDTITITHRDRSNKVETVTLPPNLTLPPESNIAITSGDTIVVSKAGIVYVLGDVRLPGGFVMDNAHVTVLQAVAMAQGANPTAKLDRTILIRRTAEGRKEIPISLAKMMAAKSPDLKLLADDVLFIPQSTAKAGFRRGLDAVLQTAVGIAVYRPL
jgi:polysaccharide export outer membrane protein